MGSLNDDKNNGIAVNNPISDPDKNTKANDLKPLTSTGFTDTRLLRVSDFIEYIIIFQDSEDQ